jgi:hypothetical protein
LKEISKDNERLMNMDKCETCQSLVDKYRNTYSDRLQDSIAFELKRHLEHNDANLATMIKSI